jgi:D-3-phosphoglycerate dehydrogenase / 2-oxoglutarate reductase
MQPNKPKILVITPAKHIAGVPEILESTGHTTYMDDPTLEEVIKVVSEYDAIFTNPNKSKVFIGSELIDRAKNLKVICTASTGTNHIDKAYAKEKNLPILALTEEREVINRISSTAEHAFALTMTSMRHVVKSHNKAIEGEWDYTKYIGKQMDHLTVGVIGYGRLGSIYSRFCRAFDSRVLVYDPYKKVMRKDLEQVSDLNFLLEQSDVIAIHVHVTEETLGMINVECFKKMKNDVLIINTSRGDIINEPDLVTFLKEAPRAHVATDVLADELLNRLDSPLLKYAQQSDQVLITQHIGGMTSEAQEIAYGHAAHRLNQFFVESSKKITNHETLT